MKASDLLSQYMVDRSALSDLRADEALFIAYLSI